MSVGWFNASSASAKTGFAAGPTLTASVAPSTLAKLPQFGALKKSFE